MMSARDYTDALRSIRVFEEEEIPKEKARFTAAGMNPEQVEVMVAPMRARVVQLRAMVATYERNKGRRD